MGMNVRFPAANPCPSEDRCGLVHAFGILAAISDQRSAISDQRSCEVCVGPRSANYGRWFIVLGRPLAQQLRTVTIGSEPH
jgi:hypothetical protein